MLNVDGGYLTFKMAFGSFEAWQYNYGEDVSIFAVDNKSKRKDVDSNYKAGRNKGKEDIIEIVHSLRNQVNEEKLLPLCSIEGLEADDIVACWHLFNATDKIVGVDKDFFQLPNLETIYYHNMQPYYFMETVKKLPEYVQSLAISNFALYQMLLGDVADNIPRLLAKGKEGKEQIKEVMNTKDLQDTLYKLFSKESIEKNAKLVLLPYYECMNSDYWFETWCRGEYYESLHWVNLYRRILDCKLPNKVSSDNDIFDLFSLG